MGKKLRDLGKNLGCTQEETLGLLVSLWLWGIHNADKDGKLIDISRMDVLEAFSYQLLRKLHGEELVNRLIENHWLDETESGVLYIHDWARWQDQWYKIVERRQRDAVRKRVPSAISTPSENEPQQEQEPETEQEEPEKPEKAEQPVETEVGASSKPVYSADFEEFWAAYPRKVEKGNAYKKYLTRRKEGFSDEDLIKAAKLYADQCIRLKTEKQYIKHPKTFLSDSLPFMDYLKMEGLAPKIEEPEAVPKNPFAEWSDW